MNQRIKDQADIDISVAKLVQGMPWPPLQRAFEQADKLARQEIALASLRQAMAVEEALTKARDDPLKEIEAQATLDRIKLKLKSDEAQQRDELMAALGAMSEVETQFQGRTIGRGDGNRATGKGDDEGRT